MNVKVLASLLLMIFGFSMLGFTQINFEDVVVENIKGDIYNFQKHIDDPEILVGPQVFFNIVGGSLSIRKEESDESNINEENYLNKLRLNKDVKSIKISEERNFKNSSDAAKYITENLRRNSIVISEKISNSNFRLRKFEVFNR